MLFLETIKIAGGAVLNLRYHQQRMDRTRTHFFPGSPELNVADYITLKEHNPAFVYKCRVIYSVIVKKIEIQPYTARNIQSLMMVDGSSLHYDYKFNDRRSINRLMAGKGKCDDILIVKDGRITDTSFSNVLLFDGKQWHTPAKPLLKGIQRQKLLDDGFCKETEIKAGELADFIAIKLINAMISPGDSPEIPIRNICRPYSSI